MRLMKYVQKRGNSWYVVMPVPREARTALGWSRQRWKSLGPLDQDAVPAAAIKVIDGFRAEMRRAVQRPASGVTAPVTPDLPRPPPSVPIHPDAAWKAIQRWRHQSIDASWQLHFANRAPAFDPLGPDALRLDRLKYDLRRSAWAEIDSFDSELVGALLAQGITVEINDPVIENLRPWFGSAWLDLEDFRDHFRQKRWSVWPEDETDAPLPQASPNNEAEPAAPKRKITLNQLLERYLTHKRLAPNEDRTVRYYVRRLREFLGGDLPISEIDTVIMRNFLAELRLFPNTRQPEIADLTFPDIIQGYAHSDEYPKLAAKTIRTKWMQTYKSIFEFAVQENTLDRNPTNNAMPNKRDDDPSPRKPYSEEDIGNIFNSPLFTGCDRASPGYREAPGTLIVKDHKYWLPVFCLFHGCRVEEIGFTRLSEMVQIGGIWCLDMRARPVSQRQGNRKKGVKNENSQRLVPVHPKLIELGFVDYVAERRLQRDEFLFPELPHDPNDVDASTRGFTKWWGLWCRANAERPGAGFDDPNKTLHGFRHAFITASRGKIDAEIRGFITGHVEFETEGRHYGEAEAIMLHEAISKVEFKHFPTVIEGNLVPTPPSPSSDKTT